MKEYRSSLPQDTLPKFAMRDLILDRSWLCSVIAVKRVICQVDDFSLNRHCRFGKSDDVDVASSKRVDALLLHTGSKRQAKTVAGMILAI